MRPFAERVGDKAGQAAARADFEEEADAGLVHRLDRLAETQFATKLSHRQVHDCPRLTRVRGSVCTGPEWDLGRPQVNQLIKRLADFTARRERLGMKRLDGQFFAQGTTALQLFNRRGGSVGVAGQDDLVRAVVNCHLQPSAGGGDDLFHSFGGGSADCDHRHVGKETGRGLAGVDLQPIDHRLDECLVVGRRPATGGLKGDKLAAAVAYHGLGLDIEASKQSEERPLCDHHGDHAARWGMQFLFGQRLLTRKREDHAAQRLCPAEPLIGGVGKVELVAHFREMPTQVREHVQVLRAGPREDKRQLSLRCQRLLVPKDPAAILNLLPLGLAEQCRHVSQAFCQLLHAGHNERDAAGANLTGTGCRHVEQSNALGSGEPAREVLNPPA